MPELTTGSYVLRLWRERRDVPWRVTLIAAAQPEVRYHFDTVEEFCAFLSTQDLPSEVRSLLLAQTPVDDPQ